MPARDTPDQYVVLGHVVTPATNEIAIGGHVTRIEPKSMEVLVHLLDRAGEVVARDALQDAIWSDVVVGDDSLTGTAASYDIRYSTSPITSANWGSATQVTGEPSPGSPGTSQSYTVEGLSRQVTYYFAARASDEAGNVSALSNVPSATTPDTMAPSTITNLSASVIWLGWEMAADRTERIEAPAR